MEELCLLLWILTRVKSRVEQAGCLLTKSVAVGGDRSFPRFWFVISILLSNLGNG